MGTEGCCRRLGQMPQRGLKARKDYARNRRAGERESEGR